MSRTLCGARTPQCQHRCGRRCSHRRRGRNRTCAFHAGVLRRVEPYGTTHGLPDGRATDDRRSSGRGPDGPTIPSHAETGPGSPGSRTSGPVFPAAAVAGLPEVTVAVERTDAIRGRQGRWRRGNRCSEDMRSPPEYTKTGDCSNSGEKQAMAVGNQGQVGRRPGAAWGATGGAETHLAGARLQPGGAWERDLRHGHRTHPVGLTRPGSAPALALGGATRPAGPRQIVVQSSRPPAGRRRKNGPRLVAEPRKGAPAPSSHAGAAGNRHPRGQDSKTRRVSVPGPAGPPALKRCGAPEGSGRLRNVNGANASTASDRRVPISAVSPLPEVGEGGSAFDRGDELPSPRPGTRALSPGRSHPR